jgi:TonB-dependent receptor
MPKPLTLGGLLLLTTALYAPASLAQTGSQDAPVTTTPPDVEAVSEGAGETQEIEVSLPGADLPEQDIVVTGTNIPDVVRATPEVVSVLSAEDIARTGEGDIAGALQRVTGLSVVGSGFVYVRGLGDRYSLALLNGLALPSPEPLRRVVPLDIFPTSVLASSLVQKSYSVNYPGEFGGGVINLTTPAIPDENFLTVGVSLSGDTETTAQLGYTYYGSDTDFLGIDDGSRDVPLSLRRALNSGEAVGVGMAFSLEDVQEITADLTNARTTVLQRNGNIPINFSADLSAGRSWDIGATRIGLIATAGISNSWRTRDALQQTGGGDLLSTSFRSVRTDNRVVTNGLLGLGAEFGEHEVRLTNLIIRDTLKQGRLSAGYDLSYAEPVAGQPDQQIRQRTAWFERQLINSQFVGEFDFGDIGLDVRAGYANSKRDAPYERDFTYVYESTVGDYVNNLSSNPQTATIAFSELDEDVYNAGVDVSYQIPSMPQVQLSAGAAYLDTHRAASRRDFRYVSSNINLAVSQQRPDFLVSDYNVYTYDVVLAETSGLAGAAAYEADLEVLGAYAQVTADVTPEVRINAGVRYEDGDQSVTLIDLFDQGVDQVPALKNGYWLPAATVTWNLVPDMQIRLNASKTLARPQFRELAPQIYFDTESDRQFFGNPFLADSQLINAEARYEWYSGREERFSLAGFYKRIDSPIETISSLAGGGGLQTTFANAPQATIYGVEVEVQKYFPLDTMLGDAFADYRLVTIGNYTYSKSELSVDDDDQTILNDNRGLRPANQLFTDGDPLTGQSKHLANLQLGIENTARLQQATILLTYASDRVTSRGPLLGSTRQADVVEEPGLRIDFVAREGLNFLGREVELKFEARNLTGENYSEYQQEDIRIVTNEYDLGTSFSLGLGVKF